MYFTVFTEATPHSTKILKPYLYSIVFTIDFKEINVLLNEFGTFLEYEACAATFCIIDHTPRGR